MRQMLDKLRSLKAETVVITDAGNREIGDAATRSIRLSKKLHELYTPIPYIIPAQLFAAWGVYMLVGYEQAVLPRDAAALEWIAGQLTDAR